MSAPAEVSCIRMTGPLAQPTDLLAPFLHRILDYVAFETAGIIL